MAATEQARACPTIVDKRGVKPKGLRLAIDTWG